MNTPAHWLNTEPPEPDTHILIRGHITLDEPARLEIRMLGVSWFEAYVDGGWLTNGPARFDPQHPEYDSHYCMLERGPHVLAIHLHYDGAETRILPDLPPFWWCELLDNDAEIPVSWRGVPLSGFRSQTRRVNPILGWIEWCDTRESPQDWQDPDFDDSAWSDLITIAAPIAKPSAPTIGHVKQITHDLSPIAKGVLANTFGGPLDDIPTRFFLRTLDQQQPVEGVWRRYDLGRVRLGVPAITLDVPSGTEVEIAYCEHLHHDRVAPYINWSCGPSCNLDHYLARGGLQTFRPLTPRGGRFIEVHVLAAPDRVTFTRETYFERCYYGDAIGELHSEDDRLDQIWLTGVETLRACSEDAITDNPTRERGQWIGDSVSVGLELAATAYCDLRPFRRALHQAAHCATEDGLVAGLCPGTNTWLAPYACHWTCACVRYYELTGERDLLSELHSSAIKNILAFEQHLSDDGLADFSDWVFIDWGYSRPTDTTNLVFDMMYLAAIDAMQRWNAIVGATEYSERLDTLQERVAAIVTQQIHLKLEQPDESNAGLDLHQATWALRLDLLPSNHVKPQVTAIKAHLAKCFPFDPDGPRLRDPFTPNPQVVTPFFAHFILPVLVEQGEMDFVLEFVRRCWGWMLDAGLTTWAEVFDSRWSHCHEWSGTPTWLLSRYLLGLNPRFDLGNQHYQLRIEPGELSSMSGSLPLHGADSVIEVNWHREGEVIHYQAHAKYPFMCSVDPRHTDGKSQHPEPSKQFDLMLRLT